MKWVVESASSPGTCCGILYEIFFVCLDSLLSRQVSAFERF
jgi:hypothetical protein